MSDSSEDTETVRMGRCHIITLNTPTPNGRVYTTPMARALAEACEERVIMGHLLVEMGGNALSDHTVSLDKVCGVVERLYIDRTLTGEALMCDVRFIPKMGFIRDLLLGGTSTLSPKGLGVLVGDGPPFLVMDYDLVSLVVVPVDPPPPVGGWRPTG